MNDIALRDISSSETKRILKVYQSRCVKRSRAKQIVGTRKEVGRHRNHLFHRFTLQIPVQRLTTVSIVFLETRQNSQGNRVISLNHETIRHLIKCDILYITRHLQCIFICKIPSSMQTYFSVASSVDFDRERGREREREYRFRCQPPN